MSWITLGLFIMEKDTNNSKGMTVEQLLSELFFLSATTTNVLAQISNDKITREYKIVIAKGLFIKDKDLRRCLRRAIKIIRDNRKITLKSMSYGTRSKLYTFIQNKEQ